jgi:hypothetical protein
MQEIKKILIARRHRAVHPDTAGHRQFMASHFEKTKSLSGKYPFLDFTRELDYFGNNINA